MNHQSRRSSRSFERNQTINRKHLYDYMLEVAQANGFGSISHAISVATHLKKTKRINIYELDEDNEPADFVCRFNSLYELSQWENIRTESLMLDVVGMFLNHVKDGHNVEVYKVVIEL